MSHERWFNKDMTDSHRWLMWLIQSESVQLIHIHILMFVNWTFILCKLITHLKQKNLRSCWILNIWKIFKREPTFLIYRSSTHYSPTSLYSCFTGSPGAFALLPYFKLCYCITLIGSKEANYWHETSPVLLSLLRAELPRNSSGSRWLVINPC